MELSILICSLTERQEKLNKLLDKLNFQIKENPVEILFLTDNREITIGEKRNLLLEKAKGKYVCFIDDDDDISDDYIEIILNGCKSDLDCIELVGVITFFGKNPKKFIHSIRYDKYFEDNDAYYRPPNHLNPIKKELLKNFKFPEKNFSEDYDWSMEICKSKIIKNEHKNEKVIYHYLYEK